MSESLQARLPLEELARTGRKLQGTIDAASLGRRVGETLGVDSQSGSVAYEFQFSRAPAEAVAVEGKVEARLAARCQRCLETFELRLDLPVRLIAAPGEELPDPPEGWELSEHGLRPRLIDLVEEELMLAVPIAPRHDEGRCRSGAAGPGQSPGQRPFSQLAGRLGED